MEHLHQSPEAWGARRSRWTLALLQRLCPPLAGLRSLAGVWRRLSAWQIRRKRGRSHQSSPDPAYQPKLQAITQVLQAAQTDPETVVLLYGDEVTVYRQPRVGLVYHEQGAGGRKQPKAERSYASDTKHRVVAVLDAVLGQVLFADGSKVGVRALCRFFGQVRRAYGESRRIVLAWDNWPVHTHPAVLAAAREQRIELRCLPTYAPWTNPIEKLWRKLQEEVLLMHRYSHRWPELKERVRQFLRDYEQPSPDLLRYVGLALPI